jgi:hypothetical protein
MSVNEALLASAAKPAGKRPYFLDQEVERVLAITLAVAQELAVARQRIDTLERLLENKGVLARDQIDTYAPGADAAVERGMWTQEYLTRIFRIVQQEGEAAVAKGDISSEAVSEELNRE